MAILSEEEKPSISNATTVSSSSLKRKRPLSVDIPNVLREIRSDSAEPRDDDVAFAGDGVGVFSRKGKKKFMEDSHKIVSLTDSNSNFFRKFFGVYDGHGGKMAAEFVTENLHSNVREMMKNCTENKEKAISDAYLKTDQDFLKRGLYSGTCCVTAVIEGPEIVVSNAGDCRAVLSRRGVAQALTKDHRADDEDERKRIEDSGGYVEIRRGSWRVHGILSVTRSIGDMHLKDWVLAEPETTIFHLSSDMEFLVLASDGLWDHVGNQEAVDTVKRLINSAEEKPGPSSGHCLTENKNSESGRVSVSPSSKLRRISLVKKPKRATNLSGRTTSSLKGSENDFVSDENQSPPLKSRRISMATRATTKAEEAPGNENESPESCGLVAACKGLADLAVTRGGLDDITVMIIDLSHFRFNR